MGDWKVASSKDVLGYGILDRSMTLPWVHNLIISPRMDRGSSEEGVDDFLRLISCALIMSYLGSAIFLSALASTFTSVALIHSCLLSSELFDL